MTFSPVFTGFRFLAFPGRNGVPAAWFAEVRRRLRPDFPHWINLPIYLRSCSDDRRRPREPLDPYQDRRKQIPLGCHPYRLEGLRRSRARDFAPPPRPSFANGRQIRAVNGAKAEMIFATVLTGTILQKEVQPAVNR